MRLPARADLKDTQGETQRVVFHRDMSEGRAAERNSGGEEDKTMQDEDCVGRQGGT